MTAEPVIDIEEAGPLRAGSPRHLTPIGPMPEPASLMLCALMYSPAELVVAVTEKLDPAVDLDPPGATVFSAVVELARQGLDPAPVLVLDQLRRHGQADRRTAAWLASASTAGAPPESARRYASVVVADSLHRHVESLGAALTSASGTASEAELHHLVVSGSARIKNITDRLSVLRGTPID